MCGIAGILGPGAEFQGEVLADMSVRIAHRGPDDDGVWTAPSVAFAHRRLSIIDLSADGHQPMLSDCGRYALVFNGEIYNHLEIKAELEASGDSFRGHSDTEVLLAALRRWGSSALSRLNGMWAFAFWDKQDRTLLAARDRFGKKPLYYAQVHNRFYFASEIKALLVIPGFTTEPNPLAIGDFSAERISDHGESTFFKGVTQLLPAQTLTWREGRITKSRYWSLHPSSRGSYSEAGATEVFDRLEKAVKLRLRADTPVGTMLSGGLDSSAITCIAQRIAEHSNQRHVFSTMHSLGYEEAQGIDAVLKANPRIELHTDTPNADSFWNDLPRVLWHQEQPFADASMVAHFGLMRLARARGVPVLLSGQAADELFAGYPDHAWAYVGSRARTLDFRLLHSLLSACSARGALPWKKLAYNALPAAVGYRLRRLSRRQRLDWLVPECRQVSNDAMRPRFDHADPLDNVLMHSIEVATLPGFLHYEDRNSMAFGVETRLPFLDFHLAELAFKLAPEVKVTEGIAKAVLRKATAGVVPDSIRTRLAKQGYPAPLHDWLRQRPEYLSDAVTRRDCPLIEYGVWARHVNAFLNGSDVHLEATWRGFVIAEWHNRFFGPGILASGELKSNQTA